MPDREKVIKGLEELYGFLFREYANIPAEESKIYYERTCAIRDALAMLKEQEPEKEKTPEYPCKNCCSPSERAACCGCEKERQWQTKYWKQEGR